MRSSEEFKDVWGVDGKRKRKADKMLFHSTSCTLPNLFFTACYPPKSMEPPLGWVTKMVTIGKYGHNSSEKEVCQKTGGGSHGDKVT